jgi:hypothetical protein
VNVVAMLSFAPYQVCAVFALWLSLFCGIFLMSGVIAISAIYELEPLTIE